MTGKIIKVNSGDKWARVIIGLGVGASKLETEVTVYDLSRASNDPILIFYTIGVPTFKEAIPPSTMPPSTTLKGRLVRFATIFRNSWIS